jgi:hypothetical protein
MVRDLILKTPITKLCHYKMPLQVKILRTLLQTLQYIGRTRSKRKKSNMLAQDQNNHATMILFT